LLNSYRIQVGFWVQIHGLANAVSVILELTDSLNLSELDLSGVMLDDIFYHRAVYVARV